MGSPLILGSFLFLSVTLVLAQTATGVIRGTVGDPAEQPYQGRKQRARRSAARISFEL